MIKEPDLIMDEKESIPQQIDSDFIILGGWEFNVSSTIYPNATPEEVIGGWNMLNKDIPDDVLNRLIQPFFVRALLDVRSYPVVELREQEPEMIELLRFCYWYFKCSIKATNNSFGHKSEEIVKKLSDTLLSNVDVYRQRIVFEEEFHSDKKEFLRKVKEKLAALKEDNKPLKEEFSKYINQLLKAVYGVTSELIFAGISSDKYELSFEPLGGGHDYDFIIDNISCQVKTIMPSGDFAKSNVEKIMNRKVKLQKGKQIQQEEVKEAIVSLIQENKNDIIKARSQKAKVICFNGTPTYANFLLNQYASDNNNDLAINNTLSSVMEMLMNANNTLMPIIFGGSAIDFNYRFSAALFTIPTTPKLDYSQIELYQI
jgi:hypothetical protein